MKVLIVASESSYKKMHGPEGVELIPYHSIGFEAVVSDIPDPTYFDWILFTSRRGVEFFIERAGTDYLSGKKLAAIGSKTSTVLRECNLIPDFVPTRYASSTFFQEFIETHSVDKGLLFPTSDLSDNNLKEQFENAGIRFDQITVYKTVCRKDKIPEYFDGVVFASPSCFMCFIENEGVEILGDKRLVAIGDKTEAVMKTKGFNPLIPEKFVLESAVEKCLEEGL